MHYEVSYRFPHKQFIDLELTIEKVAGNTLELQLPAWRPGRYELQNFAQNIRSFSVLDGQGLPLPFQKIKKDRWRVETSNTRRVVVRYSYYASQMDAGGSWLDHSQLYINWITCALAVVGRENEAYTIKMGIPDNYTIATSLEKKENKLKASNYYELVDSPLIASPDIKHHQFEESNCKFHIWIQGNCMPDWEKMENEFRAFTKVQVELFGVFPTKAYHYLVQILPYKHYHGVEHAHSTVITLGPAEKFDDPSLYDEFLGVSSHELFHTWNVTRIRPSEMVPYNFEGENYFQTGFIAEGITTYYGDLMLKRSGVFSQERYFLELNRLFKRHFENYGRFNMSLADSSTDLWLDGYKAGIPNRKVSIYVKGAMAALLLDLELRLKTNHQKSLDDVLKVLWNKFGSGQKGYRTEDYIKIVNNVAGRDMEKYFEAYIFGTTPIEERLHELLQQVGCDFAQKLPESSLEKIFGMKLSKGHGTYKVTKIATGSPADQFLCINDELIAINGIKITDNPDSLVSLSSPKLQLAFFRNNQLFSCALTPDQKHYFISYEIKIKDHISEAQKQHISSWLG